MLLICHTDSVLQLGFVMQILLYRFVIYTYIYIHLSLSLYIYIWYVYIYIYIDILWYECHSSGSFVYRSIYVILLVSSLPFLFFLCVFSFLFSFLKHNIYIYIYLHICSYKLPLAWVWARNATQLRQLRLPLRALLPPGHEARRRLSAGPPWWLPYVFKHAFELLLRD